jgi:predicted lipoprotein
MRNKSSVYLCIIFAVFFISCTVVRHDKSGVTSTQREAGDLAVSASTFDPVQYATMIWEPVVLPRIENLSIDFKVLLAGLEADEYGTSQKYGYRLLEEGNHFNFAIKGKIKILSVNTESANGTVSVDFAPFDNIPDAIMNIGPVFRGSTIRDIQNTISLNDFTNQVEFARLARELNGKVRDIVLDGIDFSQYIGSEAEMIGVFTYEGRGRTIEITPVRLSFN